jgi:DNA-binding SARP family transcriptional activator
MSMTQSDPDFALRSSQIAVSLYKGDYLEEWLYDSWTLEERERLLARYLANATSLANRLLEHGEIQQAIHFCERVLRRDHCYEKAYQVLIRAYARSGNRSQAMRSYTRYKKVLKDDMEIDPLPETIELYEQLKRNEKI